MQTSDMLARESSLRAVANHATSFRCALCGGTDLVVELGQYEGGIIVRLTCRTCPNYRDWMVEETA